MNKALMLYSIAFVTMWLGFQQPSLAWLTPVSILILFVGAVWLWQSEGHSIYDLGLRHVASWHLNVCLGVSIGLFLTVSLIVVQVVSKWITLVPSPWSAADLLGAIVKVPLTVAVEELVFRGYFLQHFSYTWRTRRATLVSSLLWALMHLPNMISSGTSLMFATIAIITLFVLGVALGVAFLNTGNTLWLSLGLHYGYNLSYRLLGAFTEVTYHAPTWLMGHPASVPESGLLGLLLASMILLAVRWGTAKRKSKNSGEGSANIKPP